MKLALHKKFIAGVVSLSVLITTGAAAPARADEDDVGRALAAILGIAIIGAAIADRNDDDDDDDRRVVRRQNVYPQPYVHPKRRTDVSNRRILPQQCLRTFQVDRGRMPAFGRRCLQRNYSYASELPRRCYTEVWTDRGWRGAYRARCLRERGYRLARN